MADLGSGVISAWLMPDSPGSRPSGLRDSLARLIAGGWFDIVDISRNDISVLQIDISTNAGLASEKA
jgi:hypothetical protein